MRKKGALVAGMFAGLASPATIVETAKYTRPQGTDLDRMRQDIQRIGGDFSAAIKYYHGPKKAR